jgi:hypothetical protein
VLELSPMTDGSDDARSLLDKLSWRHRWISEALINTVFILKFERPVKSGLISDLRLKMNISPHYLFCSSGPHSGPPGGLALTLMETTPTEIVASADRDSAVPTCCC